MTQLSTDDDEMPEARGDDDFSAEDGNITDDIPNDTTTQERFGTVSSVSWEEARGGRMSRSLTRLSRGGSPGR